MKVYMIRHRGTGQYSTGSVDTRFANQERGKVWRTRGDVVRHLKLLKTYDKLDCYDNCELVEFKLDIMNSTAVCYVV